MVLLMTSLQSLAIAKQADACVFQVAGLRSLGRAAQLSSLDPGGSLGHLWQAALRVVSSELEDVYRFNSE